MLHAPALALQNRLDVPQNQRALRLVLLLRAVGLIAPRLDDLAQGGINLGEPGDDAPGIGANPGQAGEEEHLPEAGGSRVGRGDGFETGNDHGAQVEATGLGDPGDDLDLDTVVGVRSMGSGARDRGGGLVAGEEGEHHALRYADVLDVAEEEALPDDVLERRPLGFENLAQVVVDQPRLRRDGALAARAVDPPRPEFVSLLLRHVLEAADQRARLHVAGELSGEKGELPGARPRRRQAERFELRREPEVSSFHR